MSRKTTNVHSPSGSENNVETRMRPWSFEQCDELSDEETRRMWREAVGVMVAQVMKNHCFKFRGKLYRQEEGGSIGLDLTGVIAEVYMSWWDKQLVAILHEDRIFMIFYKRYVDDINLVLDEETEEGANEDAEPRDNRIMERVRAKANRRGGRKRKKRRGTGTTGKNTMA